MLSTWTSLKFCCLVMGNRKRRNVGFQHFLIYKPEHFLLGISNPGLNEMRRKKKNQLNEMTDE